MSDEEHSEPLLQCAAGDRGIRARESSPIKKAAQSERPFFLFLDPRKCGYKFARPLAA